MCVLFQEYLHTNVHVKIGKASNTDFKLESHDDSEIMVLISCDYIKALNLDVKNCEVAFMYDQSEYPIRLIGNAFPYLFILFVC